MDCLDALLKLMCVVMFYFDGLDRVSSQDFVEWSRDSISLDEGGNVDLSCTAGHMTMFDVVRLTRNYDLADARKGKVKVEVVTEDDRAWRGHYGHEGYNRDRAWAGGNEEEDEDGDLEEEKKQEGEEEEYLEDSYTMVDNTDVKAPFSRISRYSFHFEKNGTLATLRLRITGVQPKDAGVISCFKLKTNKEVAKTRIIVKEKSRELWFVSLVRNSDRFLLATRNASHLSLNADRHDGFGCLVSSYNDFVGPSNLDLLVDGRKLDDAAFETHLKLFSPSERDLPHVQFRSIAFVRRPDLVPMDGRIVECQSTGKTIKHRIRVHYPPVLKSCSRDGPSEGRHLSLACTVLSQTPFTVKVTQGSGHREAKHVLTEQALTKQEVKINVTLLEETELETVTLYLANSAGSRTKIFDLSLENDEAEEEEVIAKEEAKPVGSEKNDPDYVRDEKTAVALGSQSAASTATVRWFQMSVLVAVVVL